MASLRGLHLLLPLLSSLAFFSILNHVNFGDCSPTPSNGDFESNDYLEMVTKLQQRPRRPPPRRPPPPPPSPPPSPPPTPQFSHYILALQWPPSICTQEGRNCKGITVPRAFSIHGLWPSNSNGASVENCNPTDKLDWSKVMELDKYPKRELSTKWPTLSKSFTQQTFFGKEWSKHGTCSGLSQLQYFETALKLYDIVNVYYRLSEIKVVPGTKKYNPATVVSDYNTKWRIKPQITCVNKTSSPLVENIGEVRFRIRKDRTTVESITGSTNRCKTTSIGYPERA